MLKIGDFSRLSQVTIKTLRYYDQTGLLKPEAVDPFTGYRYYTLDQLPRLNRILVLKDLGLSLEQIARLLDDTLTTDEIRGMLRLKRAALEQEIHDAQARMARLENRLRQIEMEGKMPEQEIIVKRIEPQQVVSVRRIVPDGSKIREFMVEVEEAVRQAGIKPSGAWMVLYHHAGFRYRDLDVEAAVPVDAAAIDPASLSSGRLTIRTIPAIDAAVTTLLRGGYEGIGDAYHALDLYLHDHGHEYLGPAREIYLRGADSAQTPAEYLTEVQYPVGAFDWGKPADGVALSAEWQTGQPHLPLSRRARTALEMAKLEAAALGQAVSPAFVLLGAMRESDGFAAQVLDGLGVTIERARASMPQGKTPSADAVVSDTARQVIVHADAQARELGQDYIGTEHLLLGLIQQRDPDVLRLLTGESVTPDQVQAAVREKITRPS